MFSDTYPICFPVSSSKLDSNKLMLDTTWAWSCSLTNCVGINEDISQMSQKVKKEGNKRVHFLTLWFVKSSFWKEDLFAFKYN